MDWMTWYNSLQKPSWTPAPATIGTIWSILYPVIIITFVFVYVQVARKKIPPVVAFPFTLNLVSNLVFTPIQFTLRSLTLASIDILIVWLSLIWAIAAIRKYHLWIAVAQVPYLIWVTIATVLQLSITLMNR
ncbi:MAG: tryptophan-rich sensory protein [Planctomycetaceae bacterium]|nr:tryptophan-rich sensory protein [Planctomycetaceae bacterium]